MAVKITAKHATIEISKPNFREDPNPILLAIGRCKKKELITLLPPKSTFFPVLHPAKSKLMRKVLDAVGKEGLKIRELEIHLSAYLGSIDFKFDPAVLEPYRECYDFKAYLHVTYMRCDAKIAVAGGEDITFKIDVPAGVYIKIEGAPTCCKGKPLLKAIIGEPHSPPDDKFGDQAAELYKEAKKNEDASNADLIGEVLKEMEKKGLLKKKPKRMKTWAPKAEYDLGPDWLEQWERVYGGQNAEKETTPIHRIKPRWKW